MRYCLVPPPESIRVYIAGLFSNRHFAGSVMGLNCCEVYLVPTLQAALAYVLCNH